MINITIIGKAKIRDHAVAIMQPHPDSFVYLPVYEFSNGHEFNNVQGFIEHTNKGLCFFPLSDFKRNEYGVRTKQTHAPYRLSNAEIKAMPDFFTNMLDNLNELI